ncbi:hypothetical protein [Vibrio sp. R78045]|uniref:hypothetical protein n=1 Tax=Vibrio sp. R78045 TaxID=3093868 RepID=UPI0036F1DE9E
MSNTTLKQERTEIIDLTVEFTQLLSHLFDVSTALRRHSPYSGQYDPKDPQEGFDVMWLSDYAQHLSSLGKIGTTRDFQEVKMTCEYTLKYISILRSNDTGFKSEPLDTFQHEKLFSLDEGELILLRIQHKLTLACPSGSIKDPTT